MKRTPNTMWVDDWVGIAMNLQDHERKTDLENSATNIEPLKKTV